MSARRRNLFRHKIERPPRSGGSVGVPRKWKPKPIWITGALIVAAVLLVLLIALPGRQNGASAPEGAISSFFAPVQSFFSGMADGIGGFFGRFGDTERLQNELDALLEQNRKLEEENLALSELLRENERLYALLQYAQDNQQYDPIMAKVIGKNTGNWFSLIVLDRGTDHGVEPDMVVASHKGLVGRVVEAGSNWCKVMTIIDGDSAVGALIQRTRDVGVAKGNLTMDGNGPLIRMYHLSDESEILPGDQVLTSGLGGVFPKGMVIGEVVEVTRDPDQPQKYASIKPAADFQRMETLLIFKSPVPRVEAD